jgi:hypothetical protein
MTLQMSAALTFARGSITSRRIYRSSDLQLRFQNQKYRHRANFRVSRQRINALSSIVAGSNPLSTYKSAPPTAQVAFKTGIYITAFGIALLAFPQVVIQYFSTSSR